MREFLRDILARLKSRIQNTPESSRPESAGPDPNVLLRAGDLARESGRLGEAMRFYGRAVDTYIEAGLPQRAEAVCRQIIEMEPKVIRTRYTLVVISVARGRVKEVRTRLADYMAAVSLANVEKLAVPSLLELAGTTADPTIRFLLAEALRRAGRPDLGDAVEFGDAAPASTHDPERALQAALNGPGDVDVDS